MIQILKKLPKAELNEFAKELEEGAVKLELKNGDVVNLTKEMVNISVVHTHKDKDLDVLMANDFIVLVKE